MVLVADVLYIGGFFLFYYGFLPVICSWSLVHQSSMFRVVDVLRAVSYTVTEYEWIFSSLLWFFFPVCHGLHRAVVWVIHGVTCRLPVYRRIFPVCCGFFPVIHSWACVHQSSIFRVVDVLCAVSYTVAEDKWIFPLCYGFFPVCHGLHRAVYNDHHINVKLESVSENLHQCSICYFINFKFWSRTV